MGHTERRAHDAKLCRKRESSYRALRVEHERNKRKKVRRKKARACDRRRVKEVTDRYGYHSYHMCTSKRYYPTLERALSAATTGEVVFGKRYTVYHCRLCGGYHLTTHGSEVSDEAIGGIGEGAGGGAENQGDRCRDQGAA